MVSDGTTKLPSLPFLPFARPAIGRLEKAAVLDVLDTGSHTTGPLAKDFEARFATMVGARHAVAVNSATAALHLALEALGVGPGDDVVVPTWTFAASAEVVVHLGARPVLVDVEAGTLNASCEGIMGALTDATVAVVAVHFAGFPLEVERLAALLDERGVALVEDAAHSFPSRVEDSADRFAGTFGRVGAFSFYATKTITTGEGGMLVTDDDALASRARVMALHGISADAWNRYTDKGSWYYEIEDAGYKYNLSDIAAAIGVVQLGRADELLEARRVLSRAYADKFAVSAIADLIELPSDIARQEHALHLYVIRLELDRLRIDRSTAISQLREHGIGTSVHFIPLHLHPYYQREWGYADADFPVASREFERVVSLPIWPGMSIDDVDRVVSGLELVLGGARRQKPWP